MKKKVTTAKGVRAFRKALERAYPGVNFIWFPDDDEGGGDLLSFSVEGRVPHSLSDLIDRATNPDREESTTYTLMPIEVKALPAATRALKDMAAKPRKRALDLGPLPPRRRTRPKKP